MGKKCNFKVLPKFATTMPIRSQKLPLQVCAERVPQRTFPIAVGSIAILREGTFAATVKVAMGSTATI